MRNRAKCTLCGEIIESFALMDTITCSCGEITISGGDQKYLTWSKNNYANFRRVGENGEIIPVRIESNEITVDHGSENIDLALRDRDGNANGSTSDQIHDSSDPSMDFRVKNKEQLLKDLDHFISYFKNLSQNEKLMPITHYDFESALLLFSSLFKAC
jgi:hypothetical protein